MRPWVAMRQLGIPFTEIMVRFDSFAPDSQFKQTMRALTPTHNVPLLVHDGLAVGTPWPLQNTWPKNSRMQASGPKPLPTAQGRAASAQKCTAALVPCATTAR